ncbi:MAG: hypothetical protein COB36_01760 [Alphaproteobacteria bacterium]|nr:MAG: hypothetical protein COB36_01760 [Alphaproteobacteria bacterium]
MKKCLVRFVVGLVVGLSCLGGARVALADMLITPTMVVFEGRDRFATVTIVNTGDKVKAYEFGWEFFDMKEEDGTYTLQDKPATDFDLSQHIVFAPRRVTLLPGAKQRVRMALRRSAEIPDGDYHVHFKFSSAPNDLSVDKTLNGRVAMGVNIAVSYAIPVVFRVGEVQVKADIGEISLSRDARSGFINVAVPVVRVEGNYSVLGYLRIFHVVDGQEELVGELSNANIFSEINSRVFDVHLTKEITGGALKVVLRYYDKKNDFIYDERVFDVE